MDWCGTNAKKTICSKGETNWTIVATEGLLNDKPYKIQASKNLEGEK